MGSPAFTEPHRDSRIGDYVSFRQTHLLDLASRSRVPLLRGWLRSLAETGEASFSCAHEPRSDSASADGRLHRKAMDPAADAIVTRHDGANDGAFRDGDEEELALNLELAGDHLLRIVVRRIIWKGFRPEIDNRSTIRFAVRSYLNGWSCARHSRRAYRCESTLSIPVSPADSQRD
jgi:hypothetical protein